MKFYLDGNEYPARDIDGGRNIHITLRDKDENGQQVKGFSGELTFKNDAYDLFKTKIISNPLGENEKIDIIIIDDCCNDYQIFEGEIKGRDIAWCEGKCEVSVSPVQKSEIIDCLHTILMAESVKVVKNTSPTDFINKDHPRIGYCLEYRPGALQVFMLYIGVYIDIILLILTPIVAIISVLISSVCFLVDLFGGDCPPSIDNGILDDFSRLKTSIDENIIGCGREHPSPLLRDYILNVCEICGITFKSSILNDSNSPYWNTVYFNATNQNGERNEPTIKMIPDNIPLLTLPELMETLKPVFNSDWRIIGTELVFERIDFFDTGGIWIDFTKIDPKRITKQCYDFSKDDLFAYANLDYTDDAIDWVGNEAKKYYSDIVEWNNPVNPIQKGAYKPDIAFGRSRYRHDTIKIGFLDIAQFILPSFVGYGSLLDDFENALLLNSGTAQQPKLLVWDGASITNAEVIHNIPSLLFFKYNYQYVFEDKGFTPSVYVGDKLQMTQLKNLYHNFHQINDPRLNALMRRSFSIEFNYICDELLSANTNDNIIISFNGTPREARIDEIQINPQDKTMTITGKV